MVSSGSPESLGDADARPLAGRRALVTGAGVGIGLGVAQALARAGASVVFHFHSHRDEAEAAVAGLRAKRVTAEAIQADLSSAPERARLVREAIAFLGGLDVLVNNAGVTLEKPFAETNPKDFQWLMELNLGSAFFCTQHALASLAESGHASVINMTSIHGVGSYGGVAAYAATKGAVIALTHALAVELASLRIRVNAIGPGVIEVPRYFNTPGYTREIGNRIVPIGRVGTPEDIAGGAVFLASDAASFITGQVLWIDGGTTARLSLDWPGASTAE
ncbi:MAG: SDR family oxidoreductase [Actinomycetota bacterium]|nr:SDR family oxidoreductase [Actinomycetota bacterium]